MGSLTLLGAGARAAAGGGGATLTWDSSKKNAAVTLTNGNLTASIASNTFYAGVLATGAGRSTGKYYFELTLGTVNFDGQGVGIGNASASLNDLIGHSDLNSIGWQPGKSGVFLNNANIAAIQSAVQGDILAVATDLDNGKIWFRSNNSLNWNNSGTANPATNTGGVAFSGPPALNAGPYFPMTVQEIGADSFTANFGASAYALTAPSGFGNW